MKIPPYPSTRPLDISDKQLLDRLFYNIQPRMSEMTFAGLYLFRHAHEYQITSAAGAVIILGKNYDGTSFFLWPLEGNLSEALITLFTDGKTLYGEVDLLRISLPPTFKAEASELRDSFDYLYLRDELATLPGKRFIKKRNRVNYYCRRHDYTVSFFSEEHITDCLSLLYIWKSNLGNTEESTHLESEAAAEALQKHQELGLKGVVITVKGKIVAFALGEKLNNDTAVCHFEKANPFSEGLYQLVNMEFGF